MPRAHEHFFVKLYLLNSLTFTTTLRVFINADFSLKFHILLRKFQTYIEPIENYCMPVEIRNEFFDLIG